MERSRRGRRAARDGKSQTLPSSPSQSSSSSSSDFEFTISSSSPSLHKSNIVSTVNLSSPDQLFYKGKILPLHRSPRLSMVQTLLLSPSSSDTATTSRDSASSNDSSNSSFSNALFLLPDSSESCRPSSVTEGENNKKLERNQSYKVLNHHNNVHKNKPGKYFSLARFSSVFRKNRVVDQENLQGSSVKRAKEAIGKYFKRMKPLLSSQKQDQQQSQQKQSKVLVKKPCGLNSRKELNRGLSLSFSENLRYPRRRNRGSSCPSSRGSSPGRGGRSVYQSNSSAMEELQSAIQGAIAHCKNSMVEKSENEIVVK